MCGLTAVYYPDAAPKTETEELKKQLGAALDRIVHRGPDSQGIYIAPDQRAALGHVRLSIIDLATGQQPLSDEDNLIHCVVTGEIYDHERLRSEMESQGYTFKTKSDSELVVQMYKRDGMNLVFHLRGEWAFVLFDVRRKLLFSARDRFGIKPLYYTVQNGRVLVASEMKAFKGFGWVPEWDIESIVGNADYGDDRGFFKGVQKVLPGHYIVARSSGHIENRAYWDITYPDPKAPPPATLEQMISHVRSLLVESVRLRLRSDVPLSVYLSGGIDSSTVAGIAADLLRKNDPNAKLTTFTLEYVEDPSTDESHLAAATAKHIDANLVRVPATETSLVDALEECIYHSEQVNMTLHGAGKILLSRAVRAHGYKVVLSGEGADEIFAGYAWLPLDYLAGPDPAGEALGIETPTAEERAALATQYAAVTRMPHRTAADMSPEKRSVTRPLMPASAHIGILNGRTLLVKPFPEMFTPAARAVAGDNNDLIRTIEEGLDPRMRRAALEGKVHPLHMGLYTTGKFLLSKAILNYGGDPSDMANAIESRTAFLDHHLVEYVNSLPPSVKLMPSRDGDSWKLTEKWILRQAAKPYISDDVYNRKKVQFHPPSSRGPATDAKTAGPKFTPLQAHYVKRLTKENVEKLGFVSWAYVKDALDGFVYNPTFPEKGGLDMRAKALMAVLSYIVLQEKFDVPAFKA